MSRRGAAIQITGLEELKENLRGLVPREAHNILRQAATGVANEIRDEIRANIPENVKHYRTAIATYRPRSGKYVVSADVVAKRTKPKAFYIHNIIEHGTKDRYNKKGQFRGKVKAQPFKDPIVDKWRPKVPDRFREVLHQKLRELWANRATGVK